MKKIITFMLFAILFTNSVLGESEPYSNNQNYVEYRFGVHKIDKRKYVHNLRTNVQSYLENKRYNGWSYDFVLEFQNAYTRYMNAFDDPYNPNRFYTDDFGALVDTKGEFNNNDADDYWYDKKGNKITGYEYRNLKDSKKKDYRTFYANKEVAAYFMRIGNAIVKQASESQRKQAEESRRKQFNNSNSEFMGW